MIVPTVLVVDDDPYTRQMVRRVLSRDFQVRLLEAEHGAAALALLLREHVTVVLLDVAMPVMDGVDTLEAIRKTRGFSRVPVMILAGRAEEHRVRRLVELGIAGFLVKPFTPALLSQRLARLLKDAMDAPASVGDPLPPRLDLHRSNRVIVVDRAPEFCGFFSAQLAPLCDVEVASSLPEALSSCMDRAPDAVFVGTLDRPIETDVLLGKIRALQPGRPIPVLAIAAAADASAETRALYDGTLVRSYVPETLRANMRDLVTDGTAARWTMQVGGHCVTTFASGVRTHLQTALRTVVSIEHRRPAWSLGSGRWVVSALEFHLGELAWDLRLQMLYPTALSLSATASGLAEDQVSDEGLRTVVALLAEALGVVLGDLAGDDTLEASCGEPRVSIASDYTAQPGTDASGDGSHWWLTCDGGARGVAVGLVPLSVRTRARPAPAA